ncbi:MAG: type VI secretion system-associated protein [Planctomycetota bacterium]|nr:MAG: type VI secretion system-associated protein [Planctomycetota bacterium]
MAIQDEIPKSRLTLRYRTEISGEPETVELPLRLLVLADFSQGTSQDRKVDLEERRVRNLDGTNLDGVMKDMGMSVEFAVKNRIDPDKEEEIKVKLPIDSMKALSPEGFAQHIPKVKALLLLKQLLQEVQANVANSKEFRQLLSDLYANEEAFQKMLDELKGFEGFKLPGAGA